MEKEDLFFPMDAKLENGVWKEVNLPKGFDWNFFLPKEAKEVRGVRLDHLYYLFKYASLLPNGSIIVEIGTQFGDSAIAMGMGIREKDSIIKTIDPGLLPPGEIQKRHGDPVEYEIAPVEVSHLFERIRITGLEGYIVPIPGTSEEVLKIWDGRGIDMLYVDGTHTYEAVKIDCQWMEYVKPGRIAVFDDWLEPVERAVREYIADKPEWQILTTSTNQPPNHPWKTVLWRN